MPEFNYTASDANGKMVRGSMNAVNDLDLEERVGALGYQLIDSKLARKGITLFAKKVTTKELVMFCVHLEQLDKAGVPLLDSLADIRDSADNPTFRDVLADLYESVKSGSVLSEAMKKHPEVYNEVFIGLVSAGERTGNLSTAFQHLSEHLKWNDDFKRSIKKATRYPIVLLVVMSILITFMMVFVVPQLVDFMTSQGFELPIYTKALIATSAFFSDYWYLVFSFPIISIIVLVTLYKNNSAVRYKLDLFLVNVPVIGPVILKVNMARFTRFFSITFASGIGVIECLQTSQRVLGNMVLQESIGNIIKNVMDGNSITNSLAATKRFPTLVVRMFKVGEDSGNMESALENVNFFYNREVEDSMTKMIGFIQPMLTVVMGIMMAWIIIAVFGPLYGSFSEIDF